MKYVDSKSKAKKNAFADDFGGSGTIEFLREWRFDNRGWSIYWVLKFANYHIPDITDPIRKRILEASLEAGSSNWLTTLRKNRRSGIVYT